MVACYSDEESMLHALAGQRIEKDVNEANGNVYNIYIHIGEKLGTQNLYKRKLIKNPYI